MEKELKDKEQIPKELNPEDLEQVTGSGNPFAEYVRVPNQQYDSDIREKA